MVDKILYSNDKKTILFMRTLCIYWWEIKSYDWMELGYTRGPELKNRLVNTSPDTRRVPMSAGVFQLYIYSGRSLRSFCSFRLSFTRGTASYPIYIGQTLSHFHLKRSFQSIMCVRVCTCHVNWKINMTILYFFIFFYFYFIVKLNFFFSISIEKLLYYIE